MFFEKAVGRDMNYKCADKLTVNPHQFFNFAVMRLFKVFCAHATISSIITTYIR